MTTRGEDEPHALIALDALLSNMPDNPPGRRALAAWKAFSGSEAYVQAKELLQFDPTDSTADMCMVGAFMAGVMVGSDPELAGRVFAEDLH